MAPAPGPTSSFRADLRPHPATPAGPLVAITVTGSRSAGGLDLSFRLHGDLGQLAIPPSQPATRADRLWEHTCCEVFIAAANAPGYREFNFSPAGPWAIYDFAGYRAPAPAPSLPIAPRARCRHDHARLKLTIHLPAAAVGLADDTALVLGLSCVIEAHGGQRSYWALAHPADHPDFHHRGAFALPLPALPRGV